MQFLDLTLGNPAADLALDEALLESAESGLDSGDLLRIWEPRQPFVVLGRSSKIAQEVNQSYCAAQNIDVLRRSSGGATVLTGPGCLMYALRLAYDGRPGWQQLDRVHFEVMSRHRSAVESLGLSCQVQGICDLTVADRKFSGNSLRCRRRYMLYHGTFLYAFPLAEIGACLELPRRQPEYRGGRSHQDFLANLNCDRAELIAALRRIWDARDRVTAWPEGLTENLRREKYSRLEWTARH